MHRTLAIACLLLAAVVTTTAQDKPAEHGLAVYKLGESFATDAHAGEAIDSFAAYLGKQVDGATFRRRGVRNTPSDALKLFQDDKNPVAVAIVSPGFYFEHKDALKLTALAEATRGGHDGEQYSLVGATQLAAYPAGKRVATTLTADKDWLDRVILRRPADAKAVEWVQYSNLADAAYEIIDGEDGAPDFVLVDRITLAVFAKDADLKSLKAGLQSELLPQDLVVEVDGRLGAKREDIKRVLAALDSNDEGKKLGELLQSPKFPAPDEKRLEKVKTWLESE